MESKPTVQANTVKDNTFAAYVSEAHETVRAHLGPALVSAAFLVSIIAVMLKHAIAGSSWAYSIASAVLMTLGVALTALSTLIVVTKANRGK